MRYVQVDNISRQRRLGQVGVADSFWLRLKGLLGKSGLPEGSGLLITPCRAVHMFGMKFPIDVAFIADDGEVVGLSARLAPGSKTEWYKRARHALELPAGVLAATGTAVGDRLKIEPRK